MKNSEASPPYFLLFNLGSNRADYLHLLSRLCFSRSAGFLTGGLPVCQHHTVRSDRMRKPFKPCQAPGCPNVTQGRYCKEHKAREQHRSRKQHRRPTSLPWRALYRTPRWRREREAYLQEHPVCVICGTKANTVDHITPHRGDPMLFWAHWNWQPMCPRCHGRKTASEDGGFGNKQAR